MNDEKKRELLHRTNLEAVVDRVRAERKRREILPQTLDVLNNLVKEGKIRYVGLSNETPWGVSEFLKFSDLNDLPRIVSVQNAYNLLNRTYEQGLSEFYFRSSVGLLAYSPLAQGYLTGKYLDGARPEGARTTLFERGQRYETKHAE